MKVAFAWAPALFYMGLIWVLSSMELTALPIEDFPLRDKGVHMLEYGVLGFLVAHAARRTWPGRAPWRTFSVAVWITVLWGLLDEVHQAFVPGRSSEALDLVADTLGALTGAGARHAIGFAARLGASTRTTAEESQR
ncbi:MAG: VanZ family protein [Sandaracinaceae bacterium]